MADFVVRMSTDDAKCTELFGDPMTTEGLETAITSAFSGYGVIVDEIRETTTPRD
jgi:hypothetical protein